AVRGSSLVSLCSKPDASLVAGTETVAVGVEPSVPRARSHGPAKLANRGAALGRQAARKPRTRRRNRPDGRGDMGTRIVGESPADAETNTAGGAIALVVADSATGDTPPLGKAGADGAGRSNAAMAASSSVQYRGSPRYGLGSRSSVMKTEPAFFF